MNRNSFIKYLSISFKILQKAALIHFVESNKNCKSANFRSNKVVASLQSCLIFFYYIDFNHYRQIIKNKNSNNQNFYSFVWKLCQRVLR